MKLRLALPLTLALTSISLFAAKKPEKTEKPAKPAEAPATTSAGAVRTFFPTAILFISNPKR